MFKVKESIDLPFFNDGSVILTILKGDDVWLSIKCPDMNSEIEKTRGKLQRICNLLNCKD